MSAPVMVTRNAHLSGAFIAECPECHAICAYWDDEDLNERGELECSDCAATDARARETRWTRLLGLLADLTDDRDTVALDDTHSLVLHIEQDDVGPIEHINDADCWGRVEWDRPNRDTGHSVRPAGFTGAARKFSLHGYALDGAVWWEPYREGHKVIDDPDTVEYMRNLLADGFKQVGLELRETLTDSLGHEHSVSIDTAWLGGIDSLDNGYLADVLGELVGELALPDSVAV